MTEIKSNKINEINKNSSLDEIKKGFKINWMNMGDAETSQILWNCENCTNYHDSSEEIIAQIPEKILKCRIASREINFSSIEKIKKLRLVQYIYFNDEITEKFEFKFGFVIPGSTNTWQQTIETVDQKDMLPTKILSGNLVVFTQFFDDERFICSSKIRIFYV